MVENMEYDMIIVKLKKMLTKPDITKDKIQYIQKFVIILKESCYPNSDKSLLKKLKQLEKHINDLLNVVSKYPKSF